MINLILDLTTPIINVAKVIITTITVISANFIAITAITVADFTITSECLLRQKGE